MNTINHDEIAINGMVKPRSATFAELLYARITSSFYGVTAAFKILPEKLSVLCNLTINKVVYFDPIAFIMYMCYNYSE